MKGLIKIITYLLIIATVVTSCVKEVLTPQKYQNTENTKIGIFKTEDGFLKFDSRDLFEKTIEELNDFDGEELDKWANEFDFTSNKMYWTGVVNSKRNSNSTSTDELLLTLIDKNGLVQIGNSIYRIDSDNELCWTLDATHLEADLDNLIQHKFNEKSMNVFNSAFQGDVFEEMKKGTVGVKQTALRRRVTKHQGNDDVVSTDGYTYRADCKVVYQRLGIYCSLVAELKYMRRKTGTSGLWKQVPTQIWFIYDTYAWFIPYKRTNSQLRYPTQPSVGNFISDNKLNWRPYRSSRRLGRFNLGAKFQYLDKSKGSGINATRTLWRNVYD